MSNEDIVARLRLWSDNAKEQDATDVVIGLSHAADEIERLRNLYVKRTFDCAELAVAIQNLADKTREWEGER